MAWFLGGKRKNLRPDKNLGLPDEKDVHHVYIVTNKNHSVFYTGVTNNLVRRIWEHRNKINPKSFTAQYNISKLVYYCLGDDIYGAIEHKKKIKGKSRKNKIKLITEFNPDWKDLSEELGMD